MLRENNQKIKLPANNLSEKVNEQKRHVKKLKKIRQECIKGGTRACDECRRLENICVVAQDKMNDESIHIETIMQEENQRLLHKMKDVRDKISKYNGIKNLFITNKVKYQEINNLLNELDLRTVKILIHEIDITTLQEFSDLLLDQSITTTKIINLLKVELSKSQ